MSQPHLQRLNKLLHLWASVIALLRSSSPALSLSVTVVTLIEIFTSIGSLYLMKLLVDAVSHDMTRLSIGGSQRVFLLLTLTGGALVATVLVQNVSALLRMRQGLAIGEYVDQQIHDRAISVDLQFYESPRYYDQLERARQGGAQRPAQIVSNAVLMLKAAIVLVIVLVLIAGIEWRLIPILLTPVTVALLVRLHFTRRLFDWRTERAQGERRAGYLNWMLTSATHAKEMRLNHIGGFFRDQYRALREQLRGGQIAIEQARLWTEFLVSILGALVFIGATAWLLQQSLSQQRPIGDVVLFVLLLRRAQSGGAELVGNVSKIVDDHLYLRNLFEFLAIKPAIAPPARPTPVPAAIEQGVRLANVSFRYDGAENYALQEITLAVRPGQIVALVGENGSGKTTLIKLLTRLYDPTEGVVTLDGADIKGFDPDAYQRLFSVIFQDYAAYAATAGENIRYGDVALTSDPSAIASAAERAGAADFIERLPQGYGTPLTKLFDNGHDLSIGQWQRLALARSFFPPSRFVILDEPTSAVDPKAEFELFEGFRERIAGRGALIISHRLSTIRQADYTYVLEGGRIVEHGRHEDLVASGGKYADLFDKQGRHYR